MTPTDQQTALRKLLAAAWEKGCRYAMAAADMQLDNRDELVLDLCDSRWRDDDVRALLDAPAQGAPLEFREALDMIQSPLAIDGENHAAAVYLARRVLKEAQGASSTESIRDEARGILAHEPVAFAECTVAEDVMARARRILELLT